MAFCHKIVLFSNAPRLFPLQKTVWTHYATHRRSFPWRERPREMGDDEWIYRVTVSEIMLQQTQAPRVVEKFNSFVEKFPDFPALARAPLRSVLGEWQGLGYNRRGLYVKKLAETVVGKYGGKLPRTKAELVELPAVGPHTAGSIMAFAFNLPEPFIETNIRSVYIHFFFKNNLKNKKVGAKTRRGTKAKTRAKIDTKIDDRDIYDLVAASIDAENPREWFFALMDYGAHLKQTLKKARAEDPSKRSRHYKKQSAFKGSNRELRAALLKSILKKPVSAGDLSRKFSIGKNNQKLVIFRYVGGKKYTRPPANIMKNLAALEREGFIRKNNGKYSIQTR